MTKEISTESATGIIMVALMFSSSATWAGPKDDCEAIVRGLGFSTSPYRFEQGGIFSRDQHIFGDLTCYVEPDGSFNSLYRRDTPVAEDGFFGYAALEERDRAISDAERETDVARRKRDEIIDRARADYEAASADIDQKLSERLSTIRKNSDPRETPQSASNEQDSPQTPQLAETVVRDEEVTTEPTQEDPEPAPPSPTVKVGKEMWVTSERLNIRSCPSESCGRTGWVTEGNRIEILEEKDGWGRIDEPVPALCENGTTSMIDDGNKSCSLDNGIVNGMITRWVSLKFLSASKPKETADPSDCDSGFLSSSDNYATYSEAFCVAARKLIDGGECSEREFVDHGGWWASTQYAQGTFFMYCGGMNLENKIYLDATTGKIFRE